MMQTMEGVSIIAKFSFCEDDLDKIAEVFFHLNCIMQLASEIRIKSICLCHCLWCSFWSTEKFKSLEAENLKLKN